MKRYIETALSIDNEALNDAVTNLQDDIDYVISGIEKLARSGKEQNNEALIIVNALQEAVSDAIVEIAEKVEQ